MRSGDAFGLQARFERTPVGRAIISAFLLVTLIFVVALNLPESHLRREVLKPGQRYLNALGLDQNWGVFAPDPRREVVALEARLTYPDATVDTWRPPRRGALVGAYSDYHWQKLMENVLLGGNRGRLAGSTARWVALNENDRRERPSTILMLKLSYPLPAPSRGAAKPKRFSEARLFELPVTADALRRAAE
jgi:hypothetical protein